MYQFDGEEDKVNIKNSYEPSPMERPAPTNEFAKRPLPPQMMPEEPQMKPHNEPYQEAREEPIQQPYVPLQREAPENRPAVPLESQMMSPTIAEPSFDPAKEFLVLLLSASTPFIKRNQLMMEYNHINIS